MRPSLSFQARRSAPHAARCGALAALLLLLAVPANALRGDEPQFGPWYVLRPLDHPSGAGGVREELPPEKELGRMRAGGRGPHLDKEYVGKGKVEIHWELLDLPPGPKGADPPDEAVIDLARDLDPRRAENAAAYLYRTVTADAAAVVPVLLGADDAVEVWLNGQPVLVQDGARGLKRGEFSLSLSLAEGVNHLLVEVCNGGGAWGFQLLHDPVTLARETVELEEEVDRAIDRGVAYLTSTQYPDGSWRFKSDEYRNGQTALALYALLKSGVPRSSDACSRAIDYLRARSPIHTYSAACQAMAFQAAHDESLVPDIEALAELLQEWREDGWAYPQGSIDLSNTQYGALGLRAAALAGVRVRDRVWVDLAEHALDYQKEDGGFSYRPDTQRTGSMTAAGITILGICKQELGAHGFPARLGNQVDRALENAEAWLASDWTVTENPFPGGDTGTRFRWHLYYLYGVERVGGILGLDHVGAFDWYHDGARYLVDSQRGEGQWGTPYGEEEPNTAFGLLFLERATASVTGAAAHSIESGSWGKDDPAQPLSIHATGTDRLAVWISSWGEGTRKERTWPQALGGGLRVRQVDYLLDGSVVATVQGDPSKPAGFERFPAHVSPPDNGSYRLSARVTLAMPPPDSADVHVESPPVDVQVTGHVDPDTVDYGKDAGLNLLLDSSMEVTVTSTLNGSFPPKFAVDGMMSTAWVSASEPGTQGLTIALERPVRADTLLLSQACPDVRSPNQCGRATRVQVIVNRNEKKALEVDMDPDVRRKTVIDFGRTETIRQLEVRVLAHRKGGVHPDAVGFAEVELQARGKRRR